MKKLLVIPMLGLLMVTAMAQETKEVNKKTAVPAFKTLMVESNQIDLGDMVDLKDQEVQIKVKNVGSTPILIRKVSTTAFLRVKSFPKEAIQPGQEAIVVVKHTPQQDGQFLETMVLESDASNTMEILKVFGSIATKQASAK
jgi:hypothetical protein